MNEITYEQQSSPTQQQPESPEVVGTSLSERADSPEFQLGQYFIPPCGSYETTRLLEELQKLAQEISYEKSSPIRADELLQVDFGKARYSSFDKKVFKRKNRGNQYAFKKSGRY